jgi:FKBP-type peptidyl-prolyl cis-trans isomerase/predicted heme/steroid binding protein
MKKWITYSLISASVIVVVVFGITLFRSGGKPQQVTTNNNSSTLTSLSTTVNLNSVEIAKHSTEGDCWVVISGKVYDLSNYFPMHPGGVGSILKYCGKDGSTGFASKDNIPAQMHSAAAQMMLRDYLLGNLNEVVGGTNQNTPTVTTTITNTNSSNGKEVIIMEGLTIEDITIGTGDEAVAGKKIVVNYRGTLVNGTQFDSSYDRGTPFAFTLGAGQVIEGWDKGFAGMKVGGKRKLTISPELGYGSQSVGTIPANSTLIFEVELLKIE